MRAAGEDHQPLLRRQRASQCPWTVCVSGRLETGQRLLNRRASHSRPSLFTCRARAIASASGGTSSVMIEPAAIHASSPTSTGATNALSTPVLTLLPIVVFAFGCPGSVLEVDGDVARRRCSCPRRRRRRRCTRGAAPSCARRRCEFLISTNVPTFAPRLEDRARADDRRTGRGPMRVDATRAGRPRTVAIGRPRRTVNGWIITSGSISTSPRSTSSRGSTIVTPASMCSSLIRSRSAAAAAASSTRVLTPSTSNGSAATCTATASPAADEQADRVGEVELALRRCAARAGRARARASRRGRRRCAS